MVKPPGGGLMIVGRQYAPRSKDVCRPAFRNRQLVLLMLEHLVAHARAQGLGIVRLETGINIARPSRSTRAAGFRRLGRSGRTPTIRSAVL